MKLNENRAELCSVQQQAATSFNMLHDVKPNLCQELLLYKEFFFISELCAYMYSTTANLFGQRTAG